MIRYTYIAYLLLFSIISKGQTNQPSYSVISLKEAIDDKKVNVIITGSYNPNKYFRNSDGNGVYYGRCMDVILESLLDTFVVLKLDAGYSLIPKDSSSYQTMFVTKTQEFPLYPRSIIPHSTYAMCAEIHDKAPIYGISYTLGNIADTLLQKTISIIEKEYLQNMIGQHILWAVANNATRSELEKYGADSNSLSKTVNILSQNKIQCAIVKEFEEYNKSNLYPAYIKVKRVVYFLGISYMIMISGAFVYLSLRLYKRKISV